MSYDRMPIKSFWGQGNQESVFHREFSRNLPQSVQRVARVRLNQIDLAATLSDLAIPCLQLEALKKIPLVHPGEILKMDVLEPLEMSVKALAKALNVPASRLNDVVLGRRRITADTALRLARYPRFHPALHGQALRYRLLQPAAGDQPRLVLLGHRLIRRQGADRRSSVLCRRGVEPPRHWTGSICPLWPWAPATSVRESSAAIPRPDRRRASSCPRAPSLAPRHSSLSSRGRRPGWAVR